MLVRVERTGREQRDDSRHIHTETVFDALANELGIPADAGWIKRFTSVDKELDDDLMSDTSQVRVIITKDALREGWDCPFAYVLALLSRTQAPNALKQMIGRVLRQPGAKRTGVDALDSAWVYCADLGVKEAVDAIKAGLDEEGMGDLKAEVRAGGGAGGQTLRVERRLPFRGQRILVPTVTHRDGLGWRSLDFDRDILSSVDWNALSYEGAAVLALDDPGAARRRATVDYGADATLERLGEVEREALPTRIDRPDLARRLLTIIPNAWVAMRLIDDALAVLRARSGVSDEVIARARLDLIDSIRAELEPKIDAAAREVFERKLDAGEIAFRLRGAQLDWEMDPWIDVSFAAGADSWELDSNGNELGRTLFERLKRGELNGFERDVALYLDGREAIAWWWRITSRGPWGLQGWRRQKLYPDFLIRFQGERADMLVLETKGTHLAGSDDTTFKRTLMEKLEAAYETPSPGEVELFAESPDAIRFQMLMQAADWKPALSAILPPSP